MRWAIKHKPSDKFYFVDVNGSHLVKDGSFNFGRKKDAYEMLTYISYDGKVYIEDDFITENTLKPKRQSYLIEEFEIVEI